MSPSFHGPLSLRHLFRSDLLNWNLLILLLIIPFLLLITALIEKSKQILDPSTFLRALLRHVAKILLIMHLQELLVDRQALRFIICSFIRTGVLLSNGSASAAEAVACGGSLHLVYGHGG